MDQSRKLAAELLGTAFLFATVVGSGIMGTRLAGGNEAIALFANSISTGAMLVVLINTLRPISGAHFNPAVTMGFLMRREIGGKAAASYMAVQIAGAILGAWAAHAMFGLDILQLATTERTGSGLWLAETVATFGLMLVILRSLASAPENIGWHAGLYIAAAYWFTASTSFANPALTIARMFTDTASGIRPFDAPAFIIAEFAGAALAVMLDRWFEKKF